MSKLMSENRRMMGDFELVDFVDDEQMSAIRGQIDVKNPTTVRWNDWEYGSTVSELRSLYEKGKENQWNATKDIDWSLPVSKNEWMGNPETSMLANVCKMMGKDEATQKEAIFDEINYLLSQLLHGEQAALQLCGQLTNLCPSTDEKFYAANQVADEARHVEVMARFLSEKMGTIYPISANLKILLDELLTVDGYYMKTLGMQTLFEGMAVGIMDQLRTESQNVLFKDMIRRVEQDESRHAAFGVLTMRRVVKNASEQQMQHMEEWAFGILEALNANQNLDMLHTFAEKYGFDPDAITEMTLAMPEWAQFNSMIYMHTVVPNMVRLGLITERTEGRWRDVGMMTDDRSGAKSELPLVG